MPAGFLGTLSSNEQQIEPSITTEFNRTHDVIVTSPTDGGLRAAIQFEFLRELPRVSGGRWIEPAVESVVRRVQLQRREQHHAVVHHFERPILEARFINQPGTTIPDGTVHQLFTITGRSDAAGCNISQPDFVTAASQGNLVLRQVIPTYGDGLIEVIRNIDIINNMNSNLTKKAGLGITGHPNYSGNDGSIQRFGWKAQVRSTLLMAANQMNVEMGVTNETFPNEIDQTPGCVLNPVPETVSNFTPGILTEMFPGDAERAEYFTQWMAPPTPGQQNSSTTNGKTQFTNVGLRLLPYHFVHDAGDLTPGARQHHDQPVLRYSGAPHGAGLSGWAAARQRGAR